MDIHLAIQERRHSQWRCEIEQETLTLVHEHLIVSEQATLKIQVTVKDEDSQENRK